MNKTLQDIDDAIQAQIISEISYFTNENVLSVPPEMDVSTLSNELLRPFPCACLVAFQGIENDAGQQLSAPGNYYWREDQVWSLFLIAKSFRTVKQMIHGDTVIPGVFDLIEDITAALMDIILFPGLDPIFVGNVNLVAHKANMVIYKLTFTTAQGRDKSTNLCKEA